MQECDLSVTAARMKISNKKWGTSEGLPVDIGCDFGTRTSGIAYVVSPKVAKNVNLIPGWGRGVHETSGTVEGSGAPEYEDVSSHTPVEELLPMVTQRIKELELLSQTGEIPRRRMKRADCV